MTQPSTSYELDDLLHACCNGTLTSSEAERLDRILSADLQARQTYMDWMAVEAGLAICHTGGEATEVQPAATSSQQLELATSGNSTRSRWWAYFAIAASLVGVAFASSWVTRQFDHRIASVESDGLTIARISATRNCRWEDSARSYGFDAKLRAGDRLDLAAGLAEVTFNSGVTVLLEGPASLDLRDASEAVLVRGRMSASIPADATQPRLRTKRFGAFEPGAQFGILANRDGGGEVHVFSGLVSTHLFSASGETIDTAHLAQSEAVRITPASLTLDKLVADDDRFVRSLSPTSGPHDGLYLKESFDYLDGPLSLQNGGFGWAGPWVDIETADKPGDPPTNRVAIESLLMDGMPSTGGRATQNAQRNRIRRSLSTSIGGVFDAAGLVENRDGHRMIGSDGRRVYISFVQRVDRTDQVFYGFELHRGDGNSNRVLCIGSGADGCGYGVTSNYNAYGLDNYPKLGVENTQPNLIVIRIDYGENGSDKALVYRNPQSLTDEADCHVDAELRGNFAFDRISLGNFDGEKVHEIDEIRVGTSYRAVTGQRDSYRDSWAPPMAMIQYQMAPRSRPSLDRPWQPLLGLSVHGSLSL